MSTTFAVVLVFSIILLLIFMGCPVFASLGISATIGILLLRGWVGVNQIPSTMYGQLSSFVLIAVPMYLLMGDVLFKTGIGADLYEVFSKWFNRIPGGLAMASVFACAMFGAMCGISIAGVATIGIIAIPEMLKRGYSPSLAAGSVTAAGALAMLIPPSLLFILYGAIAEVSLDKLFVGGIVPGLILALMMCIYIAIRVLINPQLAPTANEVITWKDRIRPLKRLWPAILLIVWVLGSIYGGIATPTEAGAFGAAGAYLIAIFVYRTFSLKMLAETLLNTARTTGAVCIIVACAMVFSQFMNLARVPENLTQFLVSLSMPDWVLVFIVMVFLLILGMFIDGASMVLVTTPILLPVVVAAGYDPLWYGIILVLNLEMAVITPPVGLNLYTLKSVTDQVSMAEILRGTMPYVAVEFACLMFFVFFPKLALWLPSTMK
jgi:tripartite ATP-independent transporter DctM subunit